MNIFTKNISIGEGSTKVAVKDNIDIEGYPTVAGSQALQNSSPAIEHAVVIQNILKNDCEIIGKTSMHELAFGVTGINHWAGTPINPKFPALIPGGSSSGSASVIAAKLADFSIGTDTGGSIRIPACCCGIFGLKPTYGRISRQGITPQESSIDAVGPFARNIDTLISAMKMIDPTFKEVVSPKEISIALLDVSANPIILETIDTFLSSLNIPIQTVHSTYFEQAYIAGMHVINHETWLAFKDLLDTNLIGEDVSVRISRAGKTTSEELMEAEEIRKKFTDEIDELLDQYSVIALPTMPDFPIEVQHAHDTNALLNITSLVRPFNLSGHPAISIPLLSPCGFPIGLQLIAKKNEDELLCAISKIIADQI